MSENKASLSKEAEAFQNQPGTMLERFKETMDSAPFSNELLFDAIAAASAYLTFYMDPKTREIPEALEDEVLGLCRYIYDEYMDDEMEEAIDEEWFGMGPLLFRVANTIEKKRDARLSEKILSALPSDMVQELLSLFDKIWDLEKTKFVTVAEASGNFWDFDLFEGQEENRDDLANAFAATVGTLLESKANGAITIWQELKPDEYIIYDFALRNGIVIAIPVNMQKELYSSQPGPVFPSQYNIRYACLDMTKPIQAA